MTEERTRAIDPAAGGRPGSGDDGGAPDIDLCPPGDATCVIPALARPLATTARLAGGIGPGCLINQRFRLEHCLGHGGMGVVYAARDLRKEELGDRDSLIAIKLLSEDLRHLPDALRMLQQECARAQELAHPNIVTVHDFDRDGEVVYMTMELLSGQSLSGLLATRHGDGEPSGLPFEQALAIVSDIGQGLAYAHKRGIVHLDLKPGNVFLTDEGRAKILDFGIARAVRGSCEDSSQGSALLGLTPPYASLEMLRGHLPDPRDDIYALAIITYLLLTGRHPYDELSAVDALHEGCRPPRIAGLGDRQWRGLLRGLALSRDERTLSVEDFLDALSPRRRDRRLWLLGGTAAVALAASLYFGLQSPRVVGVDLFDNPPPAAVLDATMQQRVDDLLEVAEVHMLVGRLISPPGGNALDTYRQVLEVHPWNRQAIAGLRALLARLGDEAEAALARGERHRARELVASGLAIRADDPRFTRLQRQLTEAPS